MLDNDRENHVDNIVFSTVIFHPSNLEIIELEKLLKYRNEKTKNFGKLTLLCFRKKSVERIIQLMEEQLKYEK